MPFDPSPLISIKRIGLLGTCSYDPVQHQKFLELGTKLGSLELLWIARDSFEFDASSSSTYSAVQEMAYSLCGSLEVCGMRAQLPVCYKAGQLGSIIWATIRDKLLSTRQHDHLLFILIGHTFGLLDNVAVLLEHKDLCEMARKGAWDMIRQLDDLPRIGAENYRPPKPREIYEYIVAKVSGSEVRLNDLMRDLTQKLSVAFAYSVPRDMDRLQVGHELRAFNEIKASIIHRGSIAVYVLDSCRTTDLNRSLDKRDPFHIFHYAGHGSPEGLYLEDDGGNSLLVDPVALGKLLAHHHIQLAVLNACHSATHGQAEADQLQCAIGMECTVADKAAIQFTSQFYERLGAGDDIERAFNMTRMSVRLEHRTFDPKIVWRGGDTGQKRRQGERSVIGHRTGPGAHADADADAERESSDAKFRKAVKRFKNMEVRSSDSRIGIQGGRDEIFHSLLVLLVIM